MKLCRHIFTKRLEYHVVNCFSFSLLRPNIVIFHLWPHYDDAKWASLSLYYRKLDYFFKRLFWRTTKKSANSFPLTLCEGNHRSLVDSLHKCNHNCNHNVSHVVKTMGIDDDVIKWKHFPRYWPYVCGVHRLLTLCEGNTPVTGGFPSQRPVTRSSGVFFDLRLNKRLSK